MIIQIVIVRTFDALSATYPTELRNALCSAFNESARSYIGTLIPINGDKVGIGNGWSKDGYIG